MKFKLTTTGWAYDGKDLENLKSLGFKFKDEPMKGGRYNFKEGGSSVDIEVVTLEQFMDFIKQIDYPIIIEGDTIEIYDDYRE